MRYSISFGIFLILSTFLGCKSIKKTQDISTSSQTQEEVSSSLVVDLKEKLSLDSVLTNENQQSIELVEEEETITETFTLVSVSKNETKKAIPIKITTSKKVSYKVDTSSKTDLEYSKDLDTDLESEEENESNLSKDSDLEVELDKKVKSFDFIKSIINGLASHWVKIIVSLIPVISALGWKIYQKRKEK